MGRGEYYQISNNAVHKDLKKYRLTKPMKETMLLFLNGEIGINRAYTRLGISQQQLYTMTTTIVRDAAIKGIINAEEMVKNY